MRRFLNALVWLSIPGAFVGIVALDSQRGGPRSPSPTISQEAARHEAQCGICQTRGEPLPEVIGPELVPPRTPAEPTP